MTLGCSIVGGADPDRMLAAVVGTPILGDIINGAPKGVPVARNCCACCGVSPAKAGDNKRVSAAAAANLRHSSSVAERKVLFISLFC